MSTSDGRRARHVRRRLVVAPVPWRSLVTGRDLVSAWDAAGLALVVDDARRTGSPLSRDEVLRRVAALPTSTARDDDTRRDPS